MENNIDIKLIDWNPFQVRAFISDESIVELAESIRTNGLLNRILVRPHPTKRQRYQLVHGERRMRACLLLKMKTVPAEIRSLSDEEMLDISIAENLQREDLTRVELARGLTHYVKQGLTQEEIAKRINKTQGYVAQVLATLDLPLEVQDAIITRVITDTHGRELLWFQKFYERSHVTEEEWKEHYTDKYSCKEHIEMVVNLMLFRCVRDKMSSRELSKHLKEYKANIIWHRFNLWDPDKVKEREEGQYRSGPYWDDKYDDSVEFCSKMALRKWSIDYSKVAKDLVDSDFNDFAWLCRYDEVGRKFEEEMKAEVGRTE